MVNANQKAPGKLKVLIIVHGHPEFSPGGGEVAAYALYQGLKESVAVQETTFLATNPKGNSGRIHLLKEGEYLWEQRVADPFSMKAENIQATLKDFTAFLKALAPDVIHFHHYMHVGLDAFRVARQTCPEARILLTLHEMLAICLNDGQMVKTGSMRLCLKAEDLACQQCFPSRTPEDFWLRRRFFAASFKYVDAFVTPSSFLKQRYVDWGLDREMIHVIENGISVAQPLVMEQGSNLHLRIGFFGQVTLYKGLDILLEALNHLPKKVAKQLTVEIHGCNLDIQRSEFKTKIEALMAPLLKRGVLRWVGQYSRSELAGRMAGVGWIIVPSIWWENSPVVIQEAFALGRPVICSDIGGMAEKVHHNQDGLHFSARNPFALADLLTRIVETPELWSRLVEGVKFEATVDQCLKQTLVLYAQLTQAQSVKKMGRVKSKLP